MVKLVIVESPAKCKKIESYLGSGYKCIASFGHIFQLINVKNSDNYKPDFKLLATKSKYIKSLRDNMKKASEIILATDDDREGEAIAWHICRLGKLPITTTKRIIFHEITKAAIQSAIANPTVIDMKKVNAQLGRQVLDRLVGFTITPVLWKKFFYGGKDKTSLSAGRCQTPALRLVYDNQLDIDNAPGTKAFETKGYFTDKNMEYKLNHDFDSNNKVEEFLEKSVEFDHILNPSKSSTSIKRAPQPFSTSSLQQKSSNELHYSPKKTMQLAQKLYEGGYITYMRTDNKKYSKEFISKIPTFIKAKWSVGDEYIRKNLKSLMIGVSKSKDKNAQEAHEAIRPTKLSTTRVPLGDMENRLYGLIWANTVESCMSDATFNVLTSTITSPSKYLYKRSEELVNFPGWMIVRGYPKENKLYNYLNSLQKTSVDYKQIYSKENLKNLKTHYTEARLVQMLEKRGIGRPSTFSSLISKIQERGYVKKGNIEGKAIDCTDYKLVENEIEEITLKRIFGNEKNKLILQSIGKMVIEFLVENFDELFIYKYTENMEKELDKICQGITAWQDLCKECDETMKKLMSETILEKTEVVLDENNTFMIGRYGPVIKNTENKTTKFISVKKDIDIEKVRNGEYKLADIINEKKQFSGKSLGSFKNSEVILKKGKFGLYMTHNGKNYSLKTIRKHEESIDLEDVIDILLGKKSTNPKVLKIITNEISVRKGKYGPYIYYKTDKMTKPKFFGVKQLFGEDTEIKSTELILLSKDKIINAVINL